MTQKKIDDLFFVTSSLSTRSGKRSRIDRTISNDRDEFDDLFEPTSSAKRRRTKQLTDVFDFDCDIPSTSTTKIEPEKKSPMSLRKRRSVIDDDENKAIDELFNNDTRKKIRRPIKNDESDDLLDMFKTRTTTNIPQKITTIDDFKTPISSKNFTTQKKIKMFFDDTDLISLREQVKEENDMKDYVHVKPVLITGGQWLSKEAETKSTCKPSDNPTDTSDIPDDQRNLMHIQYAPLIIDDPIDTRKKSKRSQSNSTTKMLDGKSFQKQLVLSDSTILRKENLQSCYNALLEDINKSSSNKQKKSTRSKSSKDDAIVISDDEEMNNIDFFDLPTRKRKF